MRLAPKERVRCLRGFFPAGVLLMRGVDVAWDLPGATNEKDDGTEKQKEESSTFPRCETLSVKPRQLPPNCYPPPQALALPPPNIIVARRAYVWEMTVQYVSSTYTVTVVGRDVYCTRHSK